MNAATDEVNQEKEEQITTNQKNQSWWSPSIGLLTEEGRTSLYPFQSGIMNY